MTQVPSSKQRSASSTNNQSTFLAKSLENGRPEASGSSQRVRQKSTREPPVNSSLIHQIGPQERQFQSITHVGGNNSILSAPLDETIFNQSFNGGISQPGSAVNSSTYNKRRQQVASINELLSVAETLRNSSNGYQVRPRGGQDDSRPNINKSYLATT